MSWPIVLAATFVLAVLGVAAVTFTTHVIGPLLFRHYDQLPALASAPKRTRNQKNVEGDPVNIAIVAVDSELVTAFRGAGWVEAQPLSRASSIGIAKSVLFGRPDSTAPVSPLFLFGRQQDVAFEREVGSSASKRHHVRFWRMSNLQYQGRQVWIGDASFDVKAGISHRGLHPTHHIDPDIDRERDQIESDLARAGEVERAFHVTGYGLRVNDHNAEGDRFDTDGEMLVIVVPAGNKKVGAPAIVADPPLVRLKQRVWGWFDSSGVTSKPEGGSTSK